jgi:hypothetical protein
VNHNRHSDERIYEQADVKYRAGGGCWLGGSAQASIRRRRRGRAT